MQTLTATILFRFIVVVATMGLRKSERDGRRNTELSALFFGSLAHPNSIISFWKKTIIALAYRELIIKIRKKVYTWMKILNK